jgi:hypothetical protein
MSIAPYFVLSCYDKFMANTQEARDRDNSSDDSIIEVGLTKKHVTGHNTSSTQETSLVNKPVRSWATGLNISSAQETSPSSKPMRPKNSDQLYNKRLVPKYSYNKRKKVKKDRCVLAYDGISAEDLEFPVTNISDHQKDTSLKDTSLSPVTRSAADEREERNPNHASTEEEVRGTEVCLPASLNTQCSQQGSLDAKRKTTLLEAKQGN